MDILTSLLQIILPGSLAVIGIYVVVKTLVQKDFEKKVLELRAGTQSHLLPLRLQAYERIVLLLERSSPQNLLLRVSNPVLNAGQLQQRLLQEVREEYNHNLSQQLYITEEAWALVRNAFEETVSLINASAQRTEAEAPGMELARAILETQMGRETDPLERALRAVKDEIRVMF